MAIPCIFPAKLIDITEKKVNRSFNYNDSKNNLYNFNEKYPLLQFS